MKKNLYTSMNNSFLVYEEDKKQKELEEARRRALEEIKMDANGIIIKTKEAIKKLGNRIEKEDVEELEYLVKELQESINNNDIEEIKNRLNNIKEKDIYLASKFYGQVNENELDEDTIIDYEDEVVEVEEINTDDDKTDILTSDMKPNRDDDKTDVLTSNMRNYDEGISESSKKEMFKGVAIVFDGKYKLYYNGHKSIYEYEIDKEILDNNIYAEGAYDFNIITMLKEFDKKHDTKLYERYMETKIPVQYDFDAAKKNKTKRSIIKKLTTITNRQKECGEFDNCNVKKTKKNKFGLVAAVAGLAVTTFLGSLGINKNRNTDEKLHDNMIISEVDDAGVSDAYEITDTTEENMINNSFDDILTVSENVMDDVQNNKKEEVEELIEENIEDDITEYRIGDIVQFTDDVDLYYASTDIDPRGNTSYLESNNYKVGLVSIVYKGQVVELVDSDEVSITELTRECKEKYGDDIEVSVNLDYLDVDENTVTQYVGWIDNNDLESKGKVLVK